MMCSEEYRTVQPCDIPWMPDAHGECTLLIEDHISANGPSRRVFMSYVAIFSLFSLGVALQRFFYVWADPTLQHNFGFMQRLLQPQVRVVGWQAYAALMLALQAIDPNGWGGRLPFVVWILFKNHAIAAFLASTSTIMALWGQKMGHGGDEAARNRRQGIIQGYATVCLFFSSSIAPPLAVLLRPADAPLGVQNGAILAAGVGSLDLLLLMLTAAMTLEFLELRRRFLGTKQQVLPSKLIPVSPRPPKRSSKETRGVHGLSLTEPWSEHTHSPVMLGTGRRSPSTRGPRFSRARSREMPRQSQMAPTAIVHAQSHPQAVAAARPGTLERFQSMGVGHTAHSQACEPTLDDQAGPDRGTYHKFAKQVAMLWGLVLWGCTSDMAANFRRVQECWVLVPPRDEQWVESNTLFHLMVLMVFIVAPLKTKCPCTRAPLDDDDFA